MMKKTIAIMLFILLTLSLLASASWIPNPPPTDGDDGNGGGEQPPTPPPNIPLSYITYDKTLEITEVDVKVDSSSDKITADGKKIGKEAKEESDVEFVITVKNKFDKEIKNIDVEVDINKIDDDTDTISTISSQGTGTAGIDFELPLKIDDGDYDVKISLKGRDADNNLHIAEWNLKLEVKKDNHKVKITKAYLSPSTVSCIRSSSLDVEILNLGRDDEKADIEIKNSYMGIKIEEKGIELGKGEDDDAEYRKTFRLGIPDDVVSGTYPIEVNVIYGSNKASEKVNIDVKDCGQVKKDRVSVKVLPPGLADTVGNPIQKSGAGNIEYILNSEPTILMLSIALLVILLLIIFLIGVIIIRLRR